MANYYNDNPNLDFYLDHPLMKRIVELKERNFADKDTYEDAPVDFDDAMENYRRVFKSRITGDDTPFRNAKVKVFGVGGAGGNTVNRMKQMNIEGVESFWQSR